MKRKLLSLLVLLMTAATGAWAQTERLLTTITPTGNTTYSETNPGAVTVTQNCEYYDSGYGWCFEFNPGSVTVEANGGYTISKCVFTLSNGSTTTLTISTPPYKINFVWDDEIGGCYCEGTEKYDIYFGVKSIQVYTTTVAVTGVTLLPTTATLTLGETETVTLIPTVLPAEATDKSVTWSSSDEAVATVTDGVVTAVAAGTATITVTTTDGAKTATCAVTVAAPAASTYTVTLKDGTEDATSWTIAPAEATTTGVEAGTEVKATYSGMKKVKSVKAKKKAAAPAEETYKIEGVVNNNAINVAEAATLPFTKKVKELFADLAAYAEQISIDNITVSGNVEMGTLAGWDTEITFTGEGTGQITLSFSYSGLPGQPVTYSITVTKN